MTRMRFGTVVASAAALALAAPTLAAAKQKLVFSQASHSAAATGMPPGLAKKGKIPPGHAKRWSVGQRLPGDITYVVIHDPGRYRLPRIDHDEMWVRVDGDVLKVARASLLVLAAAGAVADLVN